MGRHLRWGALALVAVLIVAGVWFVRRDGTTEEAEDPGPTPASFPPGQLLVPGELEGLDLRFLQRTDGSRTGPLVVARVDGAVVAITTGQVHSYDFPQTDMHLRAGDMTYATPTDDGVIISLASHDLGSAELEQVAEQVELDGAGRIVAPGELIGEIPGAWDAPEPGVSADYKALDTWWNEPVRVVSATPEVQAAYLALAPDGWISLRTHISCCDGQVERGRREVDVEGRKATIASLAYSARIIVVDGDPGAVVVAGPRFTDEQLIAIAASLEPVPPERFRALP